jgi:hypothetical protein
LSMFSTGMNIISVEEGGSWSGRQNVGKCLSHCVIDIDTDYIHFLNMFFPSLILSRFVLN